MSRGFPVVVLENAAEPLLAADLVRIDRTSTIWRLPAHRSGEAERHMRPLSVVVVDVLGQEMIQVPGPEYDEVVEAFDLDALDQPFDLPSCASIPCVRFERVFRGEPCHAAFR